MATWGRVGWWDEEKEVDLRNIKDSLPGWYQISSH